MSIFCSVTTFYYIFYSLLKVIKLEHKLSSICPETTSLKKIRFGSICPYPITWKPFGTLLRATCVKHYTRLSMKKKVSGGLILCVCPKRPWVTFSLELHFKMLVLLQQNLLKPCIGFNKANTPHLHTSTHTVHYLLHPLYPV